MPRIEEIQQILSRATGTQQPDFRPTEFPAADIVDTYPVEGSVEIPTDEVRDCTIINCRTNRSDSRTRSYQTQINHTHL